MSAATPTTTWAEDVEQSLPLLTFGAVCLVLAYASVASGAHVGANRFPLWELFLAIGGIGLSGGLASVFAGPDLDEAPTAGSRRSAKAPVKGPTPAAGRDRPGSGWEAPAARSSVLDPSLGAQDRGLPASLASAPARSGTLWPRAGTGVRSLSARRGAGVGVTEPSSVRSLRRIEGDLQRGKAGNGRRRAVTAEGIHEELDSLVASLVDSGADAGHAASYFPGRAPCSGCGAVAPEEDLPGECDRCRSPLCEVCTALGEAGRGPILCAACAAGGTSRRRSMAPDGGPVAGS